ncbi:hypothetical protein ASG52_05825 [Methylobacterium sp. Leaf456]|uniref:hypothetical protein n=1 Tax=Methylobacterium sp. Leaf456 TaxID=1736382 RepID=UPI0006F92517|nr:hypothetical protein [Methylobacterium sp. Leaf456]KQT53626.1 hypothetical protein ASG52_05825 [Methylobacterium sp. Leaf456]
MRGTITTARLAAILGLALTGGAQAESGGFFKNMFGGGGSGDGGGGGGNLLAPKAFDPDDVYCPNVVVPEGGAAIQAFAGAAGDNTRLRHQIVVSRLSRECRALGDGSVSVRVGIELRAMLGPAGAPGRFEAPVTVSILYGEKPVMSRPHRVAIPIPAGTAQGEASVIENDLVVPADKAMGYDIAVTLSARKTAKPVARRKPAPAADAAQSEAPVPGQ